MILKKGAPKAHLFLICIFRVTQAKLKIELFKLFAKVLLAFRPFAMCLKMMKFCSSVEESILLYFFESGVFRWLPLTFPAQKQCRTKIEKKQNIYSLILDD
jgi:hypothetical protein